MLRRCFECLLDAVYRSPIRKLEHFRAIRLGILTSLCATHIVFTIQHHYEQVYGEQAGAERSRQAARCPKRPPAGSALVWRMSKPVDVPANEHRQHGAVEASSRSAAASFPREHELEWRHFPKVTRWYWIIKRLSLVWMCYILVRYAALEIYAKELNKILVPLLHYQVQCILLGRFVANEKFSGFLSCLFASILLIWAANVFLRRPPYLISALHLMLLSHHDIRLFYARLANLSNTSDSSFVLSKQHSSELLGFRLTNEEARQLKPREMFLLDTMCYKLATSTGVNYVLRQNRTLESYAKLRRFVAISIYTVNFWIILIGSWILAYSATRVALDSRHLRVYPKCDSYLEHLNGSSQLDEWSVTLTRHHLVSGAADMVENIILWAEGGIFLVYGCFITCFVNYDLLLQWQGIDEQVRALLAHSNGYARSEVARASAKFVDESMRQLQAQIMDFFSQVRQVDWPISDALKISVFGWLYFVAAFTFLVQGKAINLPRAVILILIFIISIILIVCVNFLQLHRRCSRTYELLCSLLAHENAASRKSLAMVLEMFMLKKFCYTLLGHYPLVPTSLITIVGYSVSCFFLVSSLLQERAMVACPTLRS